MTKYDFSCSDKYLSYLLLMDSNLVMVCVIRPLSSLNVLDKVKTITVIQNYTAETLKTYCCLKHCLLSLYSYTDRYDKAYCCSCLS